MLSASIRMAVRPAFVPALIVLLSLCACSDRSTTDPIAQSTSARSVASTDAMGHGHDTPDAGAYPLAVGNEWDYAGSFRVAIVEDGDDPAWTEIDRTEFDHVIGTETRPEGEYRLVEQVTNEPGYGGETIWWERLRQTRAGLFALDVPLTEPPLDAPVVLRVPVARRDATWERLAADLPAGRREAYRRAWNVLMEKRSAVAGAMAALGRGHGGAHDDEIVRLVYPLHPGRTWVMRENPHFEAFVEGSDLLDLPIGKTRAWRIRIDSDLFSPADRAVTWYGKAGFLGQSVHTVAIATDENGQPIGTAIADDLLFLTDVNLNRPRGDH